MLLIKQGDLYLYSLYSGTKWIVSLYIIAANKNPFTVLITLCGILIWIYISTHVINYRTIHPIANYTSVISRFSRHLMIFNNFFSVYFMTSFIFWFWIFNNNLKKGKRARCCKQYKCERQWVFLSGTVNVVGSNYQFYKFNPFGSVCL